MKYLKGLFAKKPHENAPKFIVASLSIHRDTMIESLKEVQVNKDGYFNLDIKDGDKGYYAQINDFQPKPIDKPMDMEKSDDLPF